MGATWRREGGGGGGGVDGNGSLRETRCVGLALALALAVVEKGKCGEFQSLVVSMDENE